MLCNNRVFYQHPEVSIIIIMIYITLVPGSLSIVKFFWKAYRKDI